MYLTQRNMYPLVDTLEAKELKEDFSKSKKFQLFH